MATLTLKGYSQNVTVNNQTDTSKVVLSVKTARLVYQDLLRYDGLKQEVSLLNLKLLKLQERESQKDTIINLLTDKDKNNQFIIGKKDEQLKLSQELADKLHKELKGQKFKTFFWKAGAFTGLVTTTFLLIGK